MDNLSLFFLIFNLGNQSILLDTLMVFGADPLIFLMLVLIFILTIKGKVPERKAFVLFLISFPILVLIIKAIHLFFFEPRPYITNDILPLINHVKADASFPSRHASIAFIMALPYLYYKSKWAPVLLFLATWVGISRIYVGVHYPLDILGGILTAILSLIISKQIVKFLKLKFSLQLKLHQKQEII